jgi:hypothetical protein
MATFRRSQIGELTGSTGSLTFSKNKSGGIVKFKSTNKNRNTVKQAQNRNRFSQSNSAWHTLTDEEKNGWNFLGEKNNNTGLNEFISRNKILNEAAAKTIEITSQDIRPNDMSQTGRQIQNLTLIKSPSKLDLTRDINGNQNFPSNFVRTTQGTGVNFYTFRMNVVRTDKSIVEGFTSKIVASPLSDSAGNLQTLVIYGRNVKAQKSESRNNDDFSMLLSFPFWFATTPLAQTLSFVNFRAQGQRVRALFDRYLNRNSEVELSYRILNQVGDIYEVNRVFLFYS